MSAGRGKLARDIEGDDVIDGIHERIDFVLSRIEANENGVLHDLVVKIVKSALHFSEQILVTLLPCSRYFDD